MIDLNGLKSEVLKECKEDHVGLWSIIWRIRYALNNGEYPSPEGDRADPLEVRRLTLRLVQELLEAGLLQAGSPTPDGRGFEPWSLGPRETLARIESEWDALGREPNIGEIVWFTATEKGAKEVEALTGQRA
jgi:hypothetical protein